MRDGDILFLSAGNNESRCPRKTILRSDTHIGTTYPNYFRCPDNALHQLVSAHSLKLYSIGAQLHTENSMVIVLISITVSPSLSSPRMSAVVQIFQKLSYTKDASYQAVSASSQGPWVISGRLAILIAKKITRKPYEIIAGSATLTPLGSAVAVGSGTNLRGLPSRTRDEARFSYATFRGRISHAALLSHGVRLKRILG